MLRSWRSVVMTSEVFVTRSSLETRTEPIEIVSVRDEPISSALPRSSHGAPEPVFTGVATRPPRFRIVVNDRSLVTRDYAYFVENQLRKRFELEGAPVIIDFQSRS